MVREGRARITLVFIICALVFLAYCSSLQGGFVYDDVFFIKENPLIRDLSNVPAIFTSAFWEASSHPGKTFYRPLAVLSYAVNFSLGGFDPFGYHLLNVLLHVGNVLLVFALADRLFRHTVLSAAVALLFGLHPINTEVVAWVSGRGDILATFFFLGALVLYVRVYPPEDSGPSEARRPWLLHGSSTLAFLLGLLAKESAATLIGVLALYELAFRPSVPKKGLRLLPFVIIVAAYLGWRVTVLGELQVQPVAFVLNPLVEEPLLPRFLTGIKIFGKYLWLLLCPLRLSVDYSFNQIPVVHTPWEPGVVISALAAIGLTGLGLLCWVRDRVVFFGLGFFFVTGSLIFANALFVFTNIFGERFMYLPGVGFVLACAGLAFRSGSWLQDRSRVVTAYSLAALVLLCFFLGTWSRNFDWRDEFSLFRSAAEVSPESAPANLGLANQYYSRGEYERARSSYQKALEIYPEFGQAHSGLGNVALAEKDYSKALEYLSRAASLLPDHDETHVLLGMAYWGLGKPDEAQRETETALRLNPKSSQAHNNLGNIYLSKGKLPEALSAWHEAVILNPFDANALYNLASNYDRIGQQAKAKAHYEQFLAVAPETMEAFKARARGRLSAPVTP
jgi:Flp pilus assembly protein TadD